MQCIYIQLYMQCICNVYTHIYNVYMYAIIYTMYMCNVYIHTYVILNIDE